MLSAKELKSVFETYLHESQFQNEPQQLYEPINYILQLGGKRFRPILVLMGYEMFQEDIKTALPLSLAIEMFHNFSLVHDDIMDEADLRRGKAAVHKKYGINTGILAGDLMVIYAYQFVLKSDIQNKLSILKIYNQMCIDICEGQQYDMEFETRQHISIPEYLDMIEKKTSVLLGTALQIGALAAGAVEQDAYHLYQYGKNLGIAFQIQDDVLDVFGDPKKFGKKWGGDIVQGKKTYLYLKAKELLGDDEKTKFDQLYMDSALDEKDKISQVKMIFDELNVREYAKQTQEAYASLSDSHLASVNIADEKKESVKELSRTLFVREV